MAPVKQAVVLAAGRGERLSPLTSLRPKVMLPVANKPILQYALEALASNGIKDVILVVGYCRENVQDVLGSGESFGIRIRYVVQEQQLGTANALASVRGITDQRFLVVPGDNLVSAATLRPLMEYPDNAVLVKENGSPFHYGLVMVRDGRVTHFLEKPGVQVSRWINTGNYLLSSDVFPYLETEIDLPAALQRMVDDGQTLKPVLTEDTWLDATYPWDLLSLNNIALNQLQPGVHGEREDGVVIKGPVVIGKGSIIRAYSYLVGPLIIGEGTEVGPHAAIFPGTSIGNNVVVSPYTEIRNSIIEHSVRIGSHSLVTNAIIAEGSTFGARLHARGGLVTVQAQGGDQQFQGGAVVAEYLEAGHDVSLNPGVLIGKGTRIGNGRQIVQNIPEDAWVL
ncbi:MAG: glucose-1-phosphate thymidylyltransferase [Dehalococcoidia bacterium]|nr:glucose-1-phosphate thymidylyltransferase [Dehalococcoidia bacterium]